MQCGFGGSRLAVFDAWMWERWIKPPLSVSLLDLRFKNCWINSWLAWQRRWSLSVGIWYLPWHHPTLKHPIPLVLAESASIYASSVVHDSFNYGCLDVPCITIVVVIIIYTFLCRKHLNALWQHAQFYKNCELGPWESIYMHYGNMPSFPITVNLGHERERERALNAVN